LKKCIYLLICSCTCLLLLHCTAPAGQRHTVKSGDSIKDAIKKMMPGDTLFVHNGTYNERFSLPESGTAEKPMVLMAKAGEAPVIRVEGRILTINKGHWVIAGLTFDAGNGKKDAVKIKKDAHHVVIKNCVFRNGRRDAIDIDGACTDIVIKENEIFDFFAPDRDAHGIVVESGAARVKILSNKIYDVSGDCVQLYAADKDSVSGYARDIEIRGNLLYTTRGKDSENALDFKGVDGAEITGNEMYGFENKVIVVQKGCRNILFEGNTIYDSQRGVEFRGEGGKTIADIIFKNNVVFDIREYYAIKFDRVENISILNNTFARITPPVFRVDDDGITAGLFTKNLFYKTGSPKIKGVFEATVDDNAWFQAGAGRLAGSRDVTGTAPGFINPGGNDFKPGKGSPAAGHGAHGGEPVSNRMKD